MSFNFGKIGHIISNIMDSDYIDIKRENNGKLEEIYSNVKCHISYNGSDNPDPLTVDVKPIIQSININVPIWVDIKNNDYVIAKKMDDDNNILAIYSGRCGNPTVSQSRKRIIMSMNAVAPEPPTPVPPINPAYIIIKYMHEDKEIRPSNTKEVESGQTITLYAPDIEGYTIENSKLDDVLQNSTKVIIDKVDENGNFVDFIYKINDNPSGFRFLLNGLYTKDNGSLSKGYHLYKEIKINAVEKSNDDYVIKCDNIDLVHADSGKKLELKSGTKLVLMPQKIYIEVISVSAIDNNQVLFNASTFLPTEEERNAYITRWYD